MQRQHKASLFALATKNLWLLLIPLVRALVALSFDFDTWIRGAYYDVLVILVIILTAVLRWRNISFDVNDNYFTYSAGVICKQKVSIPVSAISAVTTERTVWLRLLGAVRIYIETDAVPFGRSVKSADIRIISDDKFRARLFDSLYVKTDKTKDTHYFDLKQMLFFSIVFSSLLSGVIFIVTLVMQGSKLLGERLEVIVLTAVIDVSVIAEQILYFVPATAIIISIIIGAGWLVSVFRNIMRHGKFSVTKKGKNIYIEEGVIEKRKFFINADKINYADMRQTLFMKICSVLSVHINCSGYGKKKNEIPVFIPVVRKSKAHIILKEMLPESSFGENDISTHKNVAWRFLWPSWVLMLVIMFTGFILTLIFPAWRTIFMFLVIMGEIPSTYLLIVKLVSFCTNGISFRGDTLVLRYQKNWNFHTVLVPKGRVAKVTVKQNFYQRYNGSCDVIINSFSEYTGHHRVKGLDLREAEKIIQMTGVADLGTN